MCEVSMLGLFLFPVSIDPAQLALGQPGTELTRGWRRDQRSGPSSVPSPVPPGSPLLQRPQRPKEALGEQGGRTLLPKGGWD